MRIIALSRKAQSYTALGCTNKNTLLFQPLFLLAPGKVTCILTVSLAIAKVSFHHTLLTVPAEDIFTVVITVWVLWVAVTEAVAG